jgi:hypothetical protein
VSGREEGDGSAEFEEGLESAVVLRIEARLVTK